MRTALPPVSPTSRRRTRPALALCALALWIAPAWAAPLADPTRPPTLPVAAGNGDPMAPRSTPSARPASEPPVLPQVQSVQVPETGSASALVDGRLVQAGDRIGGAVIASIDRQGLTLRAAAGASAATGKERLWLFGSGAKQPAGTLAETRTARFTPAATSSLTSAPASAPAAQTVAVELPRQSSQDRTPERAGPPAGTVSMAGKRTAP